MRIVIPQDGQPVKYWEDGTVKYIRKCIYCEGDNPEVWFQVPPRFESAYKITEENAIPVETTVKRALYKRVEEPNCAGIAQYHFVRLE